MSETQRTLLIVDDSTVNRILLANIFKDRYTILEASNGQEALDMLKIHVDVVSAMLLDLMMPVMNGYEVLRKVAEDAELSEIPVIVISGADQKEEITALQLGASDFVLKPFEPTITSQRVDNVVRHRELEEMRTRFLLLQKQTEAEVHLDAIISNLPGAVFTLEVVGSHFEFRYYNEMICRLSAFTDIEQFDQVTGSDLRPLIYGPDYSLLERELSNAYTDASARAEIAVRLANPEGELHWVRLNGSARTDPSGKKLLYCVAINIDKEKEQERVSQQALADLKFRAEFDSLTRIFNADAFYDNAKALLIANPDIDYTIMCWNIEQFKLLNSFVAREVADGILKEIAEVLVRNIAPIGVYGRIGGDRFAACIPSSKLDVENLLRQAEARFAAIGFPNMVNLATGLYDHAGPVVPVTRMCDCAILAMQSIKGNYLTRVAHYDQQLQEQALLETEIANDMQRALSDDEFIPYFQPIFNARSQTIESAEVLVRWAHPAKGLIPPSVFVPLFERNGFITKLDPYMWEQTCSFLRQRLDAGKPVIPLSVNISRADLFNPALGESIIALVDRYGLDHSLVCLEITESAYTDRPEQLIATVQNLRGHGFSVLMDDFGSGYSSLNTLKDLPVDVLKIDMKFLEGFDTTARAGNIVASIIRLASWLSLTTVAEGVETREQAEFLRSVGCNKIQGYYFAQPMSLDDFASKLDALVVDQTFPPKAGSSADRGIDSPAQADLDYLLSNPQLFSALLDRLPFVCALYSLSEDDRLELIRANLRYGEITGMRTADENTTDVLTRTDETNRQAILEALRSARRNDMAERRVIERHHLDGHLLKLDCTFCSIGGSDQFPFFMVFFDEVR